MMRPNGQYAAGQKSVVGSERLLMKFAHAYREMFGHVVAGVIQIQIHRYEIDVVQNDAVELPLQIAHQIVEAHVVQAAFIERYRFPLVFHLLLYFLLIAAAAAAAAAAAIIAEKQTLQF